MSSLLSWYEDLVYITPCIKLLHVLYYLFCFFLKLLCAAVSGFRPYLQSLRKCQYPIKGWFPFSRISIFKIFQAAYMLFFISLITEKQAYSTVQKPLILSASYCDRKFLSVRPCLFLKTPYFIDITLSMNTIRLPSVIIPPGVILIHYLLAPQHFLYFFPLPQGHGSFLPGSFCFITVPESLCFFAISFLF